MTNEIQSDTLEQLFPDIVQFAPLPILVTDNQANIIYINKAFTQMTGYYLNEIKGQNPRIFSAGQTPREIYDKMWETVLSGSRWTGDFLNRRKDGEVYWEAISIAPIMNSANEITHFVGIWQNITQRKNYEEQLTEESRTDNLTGILNRRAMLEQLELELERAKRYKHPLSGIIFDIDNFQRINDTFGHPVGDMVIRAFARELSGSIRKLDSVGRIGGDEFIVLLPEASNEIAKKVVERISGKLTNYARNVVGDISDFTGTAGVITFTDFKNMTIGMFVEEIDKIMLEAKKSGTAKINFA